jgi:predicted ArsR family transcriptional regulator
VNDDAVPDPVASIALLDEPNRRRLYEFVSANRETTGRDDAAAALGISRELAAFHLDRLVGGGLLETEYRRRSGRSGPGAGRPAKLYRRTDREVAITIPPRQYDVAADVFAEVLGRLGCVAGAGAVADVARERGMDLGTEARRKLGPRPSRRRRLTALVDLLREGGYEPVIDEAAETVRLRNCPYRALVSRHQELTCGMNLAWTEGVTTAIDAPLRPELIPTPGYCCVAFRPPPESRRTGAPELVQPVSEPDRE